MSENAESPFQNILTGMKIGAIGITLYVIYRFIRPYWYAIRIDHWLGVERDYIKDYSSSINPFGYFRYEVYLSEEGDPDIVIENTGRRVPVTIRAERNFNPDILGNLIGRVNNQDIVDATMDEHRQFLEEIEWLLEGSPGVSWFIDMEGEACAPDEAEGVKFEYRIYPDAVSQHEILNGIVEIATTLMRIGSRESYYADKLESRT